MCENLEIQAFQFLGLASYTNPENVRQRTSESPFRVLNALYLITITNINKGRTETYPCKETIAKVAKCSRSKVTEFINSPAVEEFCHVIREYDHANKRFRANRYVVKQWVINFFQLFWRSGMMKHFKTDYKRWFTTFKKRIYNWLIPLFQKGKTIKEIFDSAVNKLSTKDDLKLAAGSALKVAGINPSGDKAYENEDTGDPISTEVKNVVGILKNRFHLRDGDIYHFIFREKLCLTIQSIRELCYRIDIKDWKPTNIVRSLQSILNSKKKTPCRY